MLILDCSSRTHALHTLSAGFGCPPEKLKKVLLSLDLESIYELNPRQLVDAPQYLRDKRLSSDRVLSSMWFLNVSHRPFKDCEVNALSTCPLQ